MQTSEILQTISEEISRLEQVRDLLSGNGTRGAKRGAGTAGRATSFPFGINTAATSKKRRTMSAAGRARIASAQKARWAKIKKAKNGRK